MCSHRTRSADIGFSGSSGLVVLDRHQRAVDLVSVRRLGEIIEGAELHGRDRSGDVAVAGQNDAPRIGAQSFQFRDHVQPVAIASRMSITAKAGAAFRIGRCRPRRNPPPTPESPRLHGPSQSGQERSIVIDEQQGHFALLFGIAGGLSERVKRFRHEFILGLPCI